LIFNGGSQGKIFWLTGMLCEVYNEAQKAHGPLKEGDVVQ
jgi:hypothetical protein